MMLIGDAACAGDSCSTPAAPESQGGQHLPMLRDVLPLHVSERDAERKRTAPARFRQGKMENLADNTA